MRLGNSGKAAACQYQKNKKISMRCEVFRYVPLRSNRADGVNLKQFNQNFRIPHYIVK